MKKIVGSVYIKIIALLGGYIPALWAAQTLLSHPNNPIPLPFSIPLLLLCAAVLGISVWLSKDRRAPLRRLDFSLLVICSLSIVLVCVYYARHYELLLIELRRNVIWLVLSIIAYAAGMTLFMETIARLRDKTLRSSLYWPLFFKRYPINRLPGFVMLCLLARTGVYLFVICPIRALDMQLNLPGVLAVLFLLGALSYFCAFVLSLSERFEKANEEKLRAERFKSELITNVSHDIRTPLTSIINYVDLLKGLPVEHEKFHEYVGVLDKKSARLQTLISDLMEASKAGTGNLPVHIVEIDLGEILGQIAGEFDDSFAQHNLTLVLRLPEQPVLARADAAHLWRVLENLFSNMVKYALPGTRAFAEISAHDEHSILSLKNTSQSPIDLADQELTEQFIRGDRARQTEGSGLGLYIAKSLMELMGGQLAIEVNGDLFVAEVRFG